MDKIILNNGLEVPTLAYGTWLIKNEDACNCVKMALEAGYRHIDTAQAYGNEEGVGQGIKESGLKREEIFITSKVDASIKSYNKAKESIDISLKKLGVDYIDLMLIHCPQPWPLYGGPFKFYKQNIQVWKAMEEAYKAGKLKAIGISNFRVNDMDNLLNNCEIKPMANQICIFIGETPITIMKHCVKNNIAIEAYSPIAHGRALKNPKLKEFADKYGVSIAQLCIKYTLQLNTISIPKASSREHIIENTKLDFEISKEDMKELLKLNGVNYGEDALWPFND